MNIQKYRLDHTLGGNMEPDNKGDYTKCDDIKHLIEWQDLTKENMPNIGEKFRIWMYGAKYYCMGCFEKAHGEIRLSFGMEIKWNPFDDKDFKAKWQRVPESPWGKQ
ncbi:MAG: hypothetical protein V3V00_15755 [Saprospiraceae bacterium]